MKITTVNSIEELNEYRLGNDLNGFYRMHDEVYFDPRCPGLSRSRLNNMRVSPKYYRISEIEDKTEETEALKFGSMFHAAMEDFDKFNRTYHELPELKGPKGGTLTGSKLAEAVQKWEAEKNCKGIKVNEKSRIMFMRNMVQINHEFKELFKTPQRELVVFATEPQFNTLLKCKLDLMQFNEREKTVLIGDYKTCEPLSIATHHGIQRAILHERYRLYYQFSFYCYVLQLLNFDADFRFIFVEKDIPFGVRIVQLQDEFYEYGMREIFQDIETLHECKKYDIWPDYETSLTVKFPKYLTYDE